MGADLVRNLAVVEGLRAIAAEGHATPGQLALAWLLAQCSDVVPIPGTRSAQRVAENAADVDLELSPEELGSLRRLLRLGR